MPGIKIRHVRMDEQFRLRLNCVVLEIAVSLGKNDVRIYHKQGGKWVWSHTLSEHLSRVLSIDWAPKTNRIVTSSAVRITDLIRYSE